MTSTVSLPYHFYFVQPDAAFALFLNIEFIAEALPLQFLSMFCRWVVTN